MDRIKSGNDSIPRAHVSHDYDLTEVHAAIARGEKIRATKIYRELTGADLRTAKDAVDRIVHGRHQTASKSANHTRCRSSCGRSQDRAACVTSPTVTRQRPCR